MVFPTLVPTGATYTIPVAPSLLKDEDIKSVRDVFIYEKQIHRELFIGDEYQKDGIKYKILDEDRPSILQVEEKYFYDFGKNKVVPTTEDLFLDGSEKQLTPEALSKLVTDLKDTVIGKNPNPLISRPNSTNTITDSGRDNSEPRS